MRKLFVLIAAFISMSAAAQTTTWNISEVSGKNAEILGYIYHTSTVGTQIGAKTKKVISGLRLVCSTKGYSAMATSEPIVAIFWQGMFGNTPTAVSAEVDKKPIRLVPTLWDHDGQILYRNFSDSAELIQALKTGRNVTFSWEGNDSVKRKTVFSLRDFNSQLSEFNALCNTKP